MIRPVALGLALLAAATPALAQGTGVEMGGLTESRSAPVEVNADSLEVDQASGAAVFNGNVIVSQGDLRLSASRMRVAYGDGQSRITRLEAEGGVTLANGREAAEASTAVYDVDTGQVTMSGNVLLTQGAAAVSGEQLVIDLETGRGTMEGRVRTVFEPNTP